MAPNVDDSTGRRLSEAARAAYTEVLRGSRSADRFPPQVLAELLDWGLVTRGHQGAELSAVDPAVVARGFTTRWRSQAAALEWQAHSMEAVLAPLADSFRASPGGSERGDQFERFQDLESVNSFIKESASLAGREILTAQPGGARSSAALEDSLPHTLSTLRRGVAMRTLYQSTARFSEATRRYVRACAEAGGQVRTLDDYFERLLVFDRRIVVIPGYAAGCVALAIRQPDVCEYLSEAFDRHWDRAGEFVPSDPIRAAAEVVPGVRERIKDLLLAGYTGEVIARRVGLKHRAYQDHISAMKLELGAATLVQLGYAIAMERGLPGPHPPGPVPVAQDHPAAVPTGVPTAG